MHWGEGEAREGRACIAVLPFGPWQCLTRISSSSVSCAVSPVDMLPLWLTPHMSRHWICFPLWLAPHFSRSGAASARSYTSAALIVKDLGVASMRVLTNNPDKYRGLSGVGVDIAGREPILTCATAVSEAYLAAVRDKLGHQV